MTDVFFTGGREFQAAVDEMVAAAELASKEIASKGGAAVKAAAEGHMDGRPGPNRRTGFLVDSMAVRVSQTGPGVWRSETGPEAVYGPRIDLGFHGADRLGRFYDQPAYPFMEPGLVDAVPLVDAIATAAWSAATRGI